MGNPPPAGPMYGTAPDVLPPDPPEFHTVRDYLRVVDRLTPIFGAGWMVGGAFLAPYYVIYGFLLILIGIVAFVLFLLGLPRLLPLVDEGHFEEAKKEVFLWSLVGLVGGVIPGVLLLIVSSNITPLIAWQKQVIAATGAGPGGPAAPVMPPPGSATVMPSSPTFGATPSSAPPAAIPYATPVPAPTPAPYSPRPPPVAAGPSAPSSSGYLSTPPAFATYPTSSAGAGPSPNSRTLPAPPPPSTGPPVGAGGFARASPGGPPACKTCGKPTTFVPSYSKYYCYTCAQYA